MWCGAFYNENNACLIPLLFVKKGVENKRRVNGQTDIFKTNLHSNRITNVIGKASKTSRKRCTRLGLININLLCVLVLMLSNHLSLDVIEKRQLRNSFFCRKKWRLLRLPFSPESKVRVISTYFKKDSVLKVVFG